MPTAHVIKLQSIKQHLDLRSFLVFPLKFAFYTNIFKISHVAISFTSTIRFTMKLIKQDIDRRTGEGRATLLPEEPEDMVSHDP